MKSKAVADWLKKKSTQLAMRSLAPQARKLQYIDEVFMATERGLKKLYVGCL